MRVPPLILRRNIIAAAALALGGSSRSAQAQAPATQDPWPSLAGQIFNDRPIGDGGKVIGIDAPYRAEDAAVVPVKLQTMLPDDGQPIEQITLVIDQNPSPLAAQFSLGKSSGIRTISTRVRIDSYTNVHAVAALAGGALMANERFVKAAGGCSAPAAKQEADSIPLGTMRFRQFSTAMPGGWREAQLMIRHPNYSGMQMDQLTRLYVPAHFVSSVRLWQGGDLLLSIESGISIAENPEFRFDYRPSGAADFHAEVHDSEGKVFKDSWSVTRA
jgi:sulfur-oxidizing protein SoxY